MHSNDLTATFSVSEALRGGSEPAGATTSLRVSSDGFHDSGGLGAGGQDAALLGAERVAAMLLQQYDGDQLRELLGHFVRLHEALQT